MRNSIMFRAAGIVAVLTLFLWGISAAGEGPGSKKRTGTDLSKRAADINWQVLTINNLWTWHRSDGDGNHSAGGEDGMSYPTFTGRAIYEDNMVFGGQMYLNNFPGLGGTKAPLQFIRVNGGSYLSNHGMVQGWVNGQGANAVPVDPGDALARIYRIRRDYTEMTPGELQRDAAIFFEQLSVSTVSASMIKAIQDNYERDWNDWPTLYGAPFIDRNGNGVYNKPPAFSAAFTVDSLISGNYDEPGVAGVDASTPADQVLYTVYHGLDRSKTLVFEGSEPIGLEVQKTVWGYKRTDALGNVYFFRYRLINKGGVDIGGGTKGAFYLDSLFLCQWSDIDLGNAGDDLAGSDSVLSMGYVYNGNPIDLSYQRFNLPPPSSGYDFLGGPLVSAPGDSGVFGFKRVYNRKNLGMSSFAYFSAGSAYTDPPFEDYPTGTGQWWAMLRGYAPVGTISDVPQPYPHPPGVAISRFPFSGDPVAATGFVDGLGTSYSLAPGDRRILLNTGPFRMAPADTQDIYMGFVVAIGGDRLSSIAVMKAFDKACQETFNLVFLVAKPPRNPAVRPVELDGALALDWSESQATINDTEGRIVIPGDYTFEGYKLYQFSNNGGADPVLIATYDVINGVKTVSDQVFDPVIGQFVLKPVQVGTDAGVARFVNIKRDYVRDVDKLYNGQEYYFAVTAYSRATLSGYTAALESAPNIVTLRPHGPVLGSRIPMEGGSVVTANLTTGESDVNIIDVSVIDPTQVKSINYAIGFFDSVGSTWWKLSNKTTGQEIIRSDNLGSILTGDPNSDYSYPKVNGIVPKVATLEPVVTDSTRWLGATPADIADGNRLSGGPAWSGGIVTIGSDGTSYLGQFGSSYNVGGLKRIQVRFGPGNQSKAYRLRRTGPGTSYVLQTTVRAGAPASEVFVSVPFSVWEVTSTSTTGGRQLTLSWRDQKDDAYWNPDQTSDGLEIVFVHNRTYDSTGTNQFTYPGNPIPALNGAVIANELTVGTTTNPSDISHLLSFSYPPAQIATNNPLPALSNSVFYVRPTLGLNSTLQYEFTTQGPTFSSDLAKKDAVRVGVFPNPYYAQNSAEFDKFEKFVTFNNLPQKATIRVFNLAGQLVRKLDKDDTEQFVRWNLLNEKRFPVASGIYIVHVDMPDVGATKILKMAVIMEQEVLDIF